MTGPEETKIVINGLDMFDVITWIGKKNKRYIANILKSLEEILGKDTTQYIQVRKLILDSFNDYTRSILVSMFGNIEGLF